MSVLRGLWAWLTRSKQVISLVRDAPELSRYQLHEIHYVMDYFQHLMTEPEQAAANAIVFFVAENGKREVSIGFADGVSGSVEAEATALLQEGNQPFRRRTRDRILAAHRAEVYANACAECGCLPATPQARLCFWCGYTWSDNAE